VHVPSDERHGPDIPAAHCGQMHCQEETGQLPSVRRLQHLASRDWHAPDVPSAYRMQKRPDELVTEGVLVRLDVKPIVTEVLDVSDFVGEGDREVDAVTDKLAVNERVAVGVDASGLPL
jgi:hypothetical protein